jgi:hypothetical protein
MRNAHRSGLMTQLWSRISCWTPLTMIMFWTLVASHPTYFSIPYMGLGAISLCNLGLVLSISPKPSHNRIRRPLPYNNRSIGSKFTLETLKGLKCICKSLKDLMVLYIWSWEGEFNLLQKKERGTQLTLSFLVTLHEIVLTMPMHTFGRRR